MRREAAIHRDAKMARRRADILVPKLAGGALSATDPWIDGDLRAGPCGGVRSHAFNDPGNFVSERKRQGASGAHVERFALAEFEKSILHMKVGVADAASRNPHQHFAALRTWRIDDGFA